MGEIGVVGRGDLSDVVVGAPIGTNGASPAETLEGLLGTKESIMLDPLNREVQVNQDGRPREVRLTPTEFDLLEYLMRNGGRTVSYDEISREVFGYTQLDNGLKALIRTHVTNLRQKGIEHY